MEFAVSLKDIGRSVEVNLPKKLRISAAIVLFLVPVRPVRKSANFGIQPACRINSFSGVRKVKATSGCITREGAGGFSNRSYASIRSSGVKPCSPQ